MKTHRSLFIQILTLLLMFSDTVIADDVVTSMPQEKYKNRAINKSEFRAFSIYDTDNNGFLSREEYRHFVEKMENRRKSSGRPMRRFSNLLEFDEIDLNKDNQLTEGEMIEALNKRLRKHRHYRYRGGK
ncbi:MAG: EF-hand domain-containing protein [Gammaproteobacteria bacterium]|nr:EF-hand domain-containing protein [Gammaproteobacteria bacterium]